MLTGVPVLEPVCEEIAMSLCTLMVVLPIFCVLCCCRSEFVFVNPNAKGSCGCGESFTT
jgi:hypothetical protein